MIWERRYIESLITQELVVQRGELYLIITQQKVPSICQRLSKNVFGIYFPISPTKDSAIRKLEDSIKEKINTRKLEQAQHRFIDIEFTWSMNHRSKLMQLWWLIERGLRRSQWFLGSIDVLYIKKKGWILRMILLQKWQNLTRVGKSLDP